MDHVTWEQMHLQLCKVSVLIDEYMRCRLVVKALLRLTEALGINNISTGTFVVSRYETDRSTSRYENGFTTLLQ